MKRFLFDFANKKNINKKDLEILEEVIKKADSKDKLENLLLGLFTSSEIEEFAERIRIVSLLKKGVAQHEVAGKLGVGVATVSRGAKEIKMGRFKMV